ncbi:Uncharacterized protein dnm_086710 [Desulfonema magnum]|uniref:Uncharacterized protein n=1 Tax=Desulfonema magnum TaxID=45655 RepID=A0A975BVL7_9BACT|nr:Uncharacterized protein dnm_086710 [Desulfonema magnum]
MEASFDFHQAEAEDTETLKNIIIRRAKIKRSGFLHPAGILQISGAKKRFA